MKHCGAFMAVLAASLLAAGPAVNATQFFYDDFGDGDNSDWTDTGLLGQKVVIDHFPNSYPYQTTAVDPQEDKYAMAEKAISGGAATATTYWMSVDVIHNGGYNSGGAGYKSGAVSFLDASGNGLMLQFAMARSGTPPIVGSISLRQIVGGAYNWVDDPNASQIPGCGFDPELSTVDPLDDKWAKHNFAASWDSTTQVVDLYYDGALQKSVEIDPLFDPGWGSGPTKVVQVFRNVTEEGGTPGSVAYYGCLSMDDIYLGDVADPNPDDPEIVAGDANADLKVDILDLTALAGSWGLGGQIWPQGDFNYDGTIDILDLTALAGNWNYGVTQGIPEPGVLTLLAVGAAAIIRKRR